MTTATAAFEAGRRAFRPGWTNHTEHTPYLAGTAEYAEFKAGWDRESSTSEHGLEIE